MLVTAVIESFLNRQGDRFAGRWHRELELQIEGVDFEDRNAESLRHCPRQYRNPADAATVPTNNDYECHFPSEEIARIGTTGWNWVNKTSEYWGFDFDSAAGHDDGLTAEQLAEIEAAAMTLDYVEIRKSKSGGGRHFYIYAETPPPAINHDHHSDYAPVLLARMSKDSGFPFEQYRDCIGGNMWIWSKQRAKDGFEVIKDGKPLDVAALPPPEEKPDCDSVPFDSDHQKLVGWLTSNGYYAAVEDNRLTTHTAALRAAHAALQLRGSFETIATGGDRNDKNCYCYSEAKGAWKVYRFNKAKDAESWELSRNGWSWTWLNKAPGRKAKADPAGVIVNLATEADELFHSPEGVAHVVTERKGRRDTLRVSDEGYENILRLRYTVKTKEVAKREWLKNAIDQLAAIAVEEGPEYPVCLRVGQHDGRVYVDLANDARQVVSIGPEGWEVIDSAPVRFIRPDSMNPLPMPERGGSIAELRPLVNVTDDDWPLFVGGLVMGFHPNGPYPIFSLLGPPGVSAKTSLAGLIQDSIDPVDSEGSAEAETIENLMVAAQHRWIVSFDNLTKIDQRLSDALCRLSTGGSYSRRKLYRDSDLTTFRAKRLCVLTSVDDVVRQPDLLSRTLRFELPPLAKTMTGAEFKSACEAIRPRVLGVLFDGVASALRNQATVRIEGLPRLADFAVWGTAAERGLGLPAGSIMDSYRQNRDNVAGMILDGDLPRAICDLGDFRGTAKELAGQIGWPTDQAACQKLAGELRMLAPTLADAGVVVEFPPGRVKGKRVIVIHGKAEALAA